MRFRFRCALLLGTVFITALLIILLATQRHNRSIISSASQNVQQQQIHADANSAAEKEMPTIEDIEVRRLLSAGAAADEATASDQQQQQRLEDASAEMAPALMSLFPIGRFPPALRANASVNAMPLNVAIVLVVSLLSIAILITAICCVIIVALALDSSPARHWSAQPSSARSSDFFLLSPWPHMASQYHRLNQSPVYRTPGLDKLFKQQQEQLHQQHEQLQRQPQNLLLLGILNDAPVDTPPLTDDDDYDDTVADAWHQPMEDGQCRASDWHPQNGHRWGQQRRNSFTFTSIDIDQN